MIQPLPGYRRAGTPTQSQSSEVDRGLVARALEGDSAAFRALYERHAPTVARRLRRILRSEQDVEDALQTTFLECHRALGRYRPELPFENWLQRLAFHVAAHQLRHRRRRWWQIFTPPDELPQVSDPAATPEERVGRQQLVRGLQQAMEVLPPKKRVAFALHEFEGLGVTEIGQMVGASPQTVWARIESARKEVQREMERRGLLPPEDEEGMS